MNIKEIVNNIDNLSIKDINRNVRRAKLLVETSDGSILLVHCNGNYFFLGGHVDKSESDMECLEREILEEVGVNIKLPSLTAFMTIKHFSKDYPSLGINTLSIANYYYLKMDLEEDFSNKRLTDFELKGNFTICKIKKDDVIDVLINSLDSASRRIVTLDTISVLREFLNK